MATRAELGTDLHLLLDLVRRNDREPGNDLALAKRTIAGAGVAEVVDLDVVSGAENLEQAVLLRFTTRQGELTDLGHPEYGSRLWQLIGELNDQTNRNRAKLYALEALAGEPRVSEVLTIDVRTSPANHDQIDLAISVRVIDRPTPLDLVFGIAVLPGGAA